jgi:hypothetical protein
MSELPKENQELDKDVDQSRRKLAKIGAAAPVIMTLASRPVFGAQCLSQMMSGNMSQQGPGTCATGWSPGGWCNEGGQVNGMPTADAWNAAGFDFGTSECVQWHPQSQTVGHTQFGVCQKYGYAGATKVSATPFSLTTGANIPDGTDPDEITMRQVICDPTIDPVLRHCLAAYLNASLPGLNYILTKDQVLGLCDGSIPLPPGYFSLNSFLDSTWT